MPHDRGQIIPRRIFLDTCTVQALADCGGFIFGEDDFPRETDFRAQQCPQVVRRPDAAAILLPLRDIFAFDERASFDWIVSPRSLAEIDAGKDGHRSAYAREIFDHSLVCIDENPPDETTSTMAAYLAGPKCGFISEKDQSLLVEAASVGSDVFLTIENKLPRTAEAILQHIPFLIATPAGLWSLLEPHLKGL